MGIRKIRELGDPALRQVCRDVKSVSLRTKILIGDMFDTMYESNGCGLAAPQVGILRRLFVVDCAASDEEPQPYVFINPEIIEKNGESDDYEGCLSVPGKKGKVLRAEKIKVRAYNERMEEFELEAEGLLARCIQHENDHLDGVMYVDKVNGRLYESDEDPEEEESQENI